MKLSEGGLRKLRRRRHMNDLMPFVILGGLMIAYWQRQYLDLPSDKGFWILITLVVWSFYWLERRLKVMQFRLALMHDQLDVLAGEEPQQHAEGELEAS